MHDDALAVDADLVRALVAGELPHLAGLDVAPLAASGSSNALFTLGDDLLVRLPRQPGGAASLEKEARWGPVVAAHLPVPVPEVRHLGRPAAGYPERWALLPLLDGERAAAGVGTVALAEDLARAVAALGAAPVPAQARADAALRWYRGGPLADLDDDLHEALAACRELPGLAGLAGSGLDLDRAPLVWERALAGERERAAGGDAPERWFHGDLLAENLLVRESRLAAVLDLGGLGVGDPVVDLVLAWEVLDAPGRARFRELLGVDDATWAVGAGWALLIALITFPYYWDSLPGRCADRLVMARAVLSEA